MFGFSLIPDGGLEQGSRLIKSRNIAFLNPSVIKIFNSPQYIILSGEKNKALCVVLPLKTVKKDKVLLPKDNMGFLNQEPVFLFPYCDSIERANSVEILLQAISTVNYDLEQYICQVLSVQKYLYCGMQIKCKSSLYPYEFTVKNIKGELKQSYLGANNKDSSGDFNCRTCSCDDFSVSTSISTMENQMLKHDSIQSRNHSVLDLNTMFSSFNINENETQSKVSNIQGSFEESSHSFKEQPSAVYFCFHAGTSIFILNSSKKVDKMLVLNCFNDIGGLKKVKCNIKAFVNFYLFPKKKSLPSLGALMLLGPSGTGKSLIINALHSEYDFNIVKIEWYNVYSKSSTNVGRDLQNCFQKARKKTPSIIVMDNFNYLCPANKNSSSHDVCMVMQQEVNKCLNLPIVIIAASNDSTYDEAVLRTYGVTLEEIRFSIPSTSDREEILNLMLSKMNHNLSVEDAKEFNMLCHGFTGKDLEELFYDALASRCLKDELELDESKTAVEITISDLKQVLKFKKPSLRSDLRIKEVKWNDIGGMEDIKEQLKDIVETPLKHPEIFQQFGIKPSRGVLLYGPPGCSKTMIAKALATECCMNFISKNVSDIHNKYVGESEKAVSDLFLLARAKSPCIIFLDEIDALIPIRGSTTGSIVEEKIVSLFLQELDGFMELEGVVIIAATNRPDRIDSAFLRNGRVNEFIYVPLPDRNAREKIFRLQMKKRKIADDFDFERLAGKTDGFSGAEIVNLCNEAALQLLLEERSSSIFTLQHFEKALNVVFPRTDKEIIQFYENFNSKFK